MVAGIKRPNAPLSDVRKSLRNDLQSLRTGKKNERSINFFLLKTDFRFICLAKNANNNYFKIK